MGRTNAREYSISGSSKTEDKGTTTMQGDRRDNETQVNIIYREEVRM